MEISDEGAALHSSGDLTAQLEASERRFRELFLQEQRRARHLSLINEVQKCALATREIEGFLTQVTRAVGSHFSDCDVSFFLSRAWLASAPENDFESAIYPSENEAELADALAGTLVAVARVGTNGLAPALDTVLVTDNVNLYDSAACLHPDTRSHLSIPVSFGGRAGGLILVQSRESGALDARDVAALQTAAGIIASHLQSLRLFGFMREVNAFNQNLLNSMLHSMVVLSDDGRMQFVNERVLRTFGHARSDLKNAPIEALLGEGPAQHHRLCEVLSEVLESGEGREVPEVHVWTPEGLQVFDLRLFRVFFRGVAQAVILLINLTQRWRKTNQLQMMNEIAALFGQSLDVERVLSTVLTCITAGAALGFNRACVFLLDDNGKTLEGRMALGPSSAEEAARIWQEISQHEMSLRELLQQSELEGRDAPLTPFQERTRELSLQLDNPCLPFLRHVMDGHHAVRVAHGEFFDLEGKSSEVCAAAREAAQLLSAHEFVVAPLAAKDRLVGVVFADNLYSGAPIELDEVQMLDTLAAQAGLAIDNALTYGALQAAQRELVSAERLVAVGEMSARVSHEIRNPLATIGGFARSIHKKPDDVPSVKRKAGIVVAEVERLEELLTDLLDMARPRSLQLRPCDVNEIVEHALLLAESDLRANNIEIRKELASDLPPLPLDRSRILQALLNTIRNGAQAMPDGGPLRVITRVTVRSGLHEAANERRNVQIVVTDAGVGISQNALKQVFEPFFSTKISGSGLGLAVTKRIIQDHNGQIDVESEPGHGTTFIFTLAVPERAPEDSPAPQ